jgi:hypothetical protein
MQRTKIVATAIVAGLIAVIAGRGYVQGEDKGNKKPISSKEMKEMMIKVHKGDTSALADLGKQLSADSPDWARVGKGAKAVSDMAEVLRTGNYHSPYAYYSSPDRYITSAKALDKAAAEKDKKAAAAALLQLRGSCASCHGYRDPLK